MDKIIKRKCQRCGQEWWPRKPGTPKCCGRCKSPYWDKPRQRYYSETLQRWVMIPEE